MKYIFLALLTVIGLTSNAQLKEIEIEEASKHIGDSVHLVAQITGVRQLANIDRRPTFINLGKPYPNQLLTLVIWEEVRNQITDDLSEEKLKGGVVIVTGVIELFKDKPQIVIRNTKQLKFVQAKKEKQ